jgi:hypothetical protein
VRGVWLADDVITEDSHVVKRLAGDSSGNQGRQKTKMGMMAKVPRDSPPSHFRTQKRMWTDLHAEWPLLLSDFNETWSMSTNFSKTPQHKMS